MTNLLTGLRRSFAICAALLCTQVLGAPCRTLTAAYLDNPRFTEISDADLESISRSAEVKFAKYLGYCIHIAKPVRGSVAAAFERFSAEQQADIEKYVIRSPSQDDITDLTQMLATSIGDAQPQLSEQIAYINSGGTVTIPSNASAEQVARALVLYQAKTLETYRISRLADGKPIIDAHPWNEFSYWAALPGTSLRYDLYFTNQAMISMEKGSPSIHSLIRGGITNGVTNYCADCDFGTASVVSLYAIFSNDALLHQIRSESAYTHDEKISFAADLTVHELGHQLRQLGHPYGINSCVMNPVEVLKFRERDLALKPGSCNEAAAPSLKPGAAGFRNVPIPFP